MADRFDDILNECTERLLRGESVEQCVQRYPEQAARARASAPGGGGSRKGVFCRGAQAGVQGPHSRYEVQSRLRSKECEGRVEGDLSRSLDASLGNGGRLPCFASRLCRRWHRGRIVRQCARRHALLREDNRRGHSIEADFLRCRQGQAAGQVCGAACLGDGASGARRAARRQLQACRSRFEAHLAKIEQLAAQIRATDPEDGNRIAELRRSLEPATWPGTWRSLTKPRRQRRAWQAAIAVARFRLIQGTVS